MSEDEIPQAPAYVFHSHCMAAMGAVADRAPKAIKKMIRQNPNGTYTVYFGDGMETTVTDLVPKERASARVGWPVILEKALAVRYDGYDEIMRGGDPRDPLSKITGKPANAYGITKPGIDTLSGRIRKRVAYVVGIGSGADLPDAEFRGIVFDHAYPVMGVDNAEGTVTLLNPHGGDQPRVTLTEEELRDTRIAIFEAPTK